MNKIREARLAKGLTMKELGKRVGVSEGAISHYELGQRQANYETLLKIGEVLDVSVAYLLGEDVTSIPAVISKDKRRLLDMIENMTAEQLQKLLKIIEAIK